ncbi:MAG: carboxypeptidase regulatory-like domain-containing protein [Candidatus Nanohaloarchaea archaeon]
MDLTSQTSKVILLLAALTLTISSASAVEASIANGNTYQGYIGHTLGGSGTNTEPVTVFLNSTGNLSASNVSQDFTPNGELSKDSESQKVCSNPDGNNSQLVCNFSPKVNADAGSSVQVHLDVNYDSGNVLSQNITLNTDYPYTVEMKSNSILRSSKVFVPYSHLNSLWYSFNIKHFGQTPDRSYLKNPDNYYISVYHDGEIYKDYKDQQGWLKPTVSEQNVNLTVSGTPDLGIGTYFFIVKFRGEKRSQQVANFTVKHLMNFKGRVETQNHRAVSGAGISVTRNGITKKENTNAHGKYSMYIMPGKYDVKLDFSKGNVFISDSLLENTSSTTNDDISRIKYQYWKDPDVSINGVKPINMMAVQYGYPIETFAGRPSASMRFDSKGVDPNKVHVYYCNKWDFQGQKCMGDWNQTDDNRVTIDYVIWKASFPVHPRYVAEQPGSPAHKVLTNAFVVGTQSGLALNSGTIHVSGPSNGRIPVGKEVTVSGRVVDDNSNFIEGANVSVQFMKGDSSYKTIEGVTGANGDFSIRGTAPDPGNYSIRVTLDKKNYAATTKKFQNSFETYLKEGVSMSTEDSMKVFLGKKSTQDVTVTNIGQKEITDVNLSADGISSDYLSLSKKYLGKIPAGESETVQAIVQLPSDYCGSNGVCDRYPSFSVKTTATTSDGSQVEDESHVQTIVNRVSGGATGSQQSTTNDNSNDNSSGSFSVQDVQKMTGHFLASQSSLNIALGLMMLFSMVLAGAVKRKKDGGGSRDPRQDGSRPAVQKPAVAPGDDTEVHQPQPVQQDEDLDDTIDEMSQEVTDEDVDEAIDEIAGVEAEEMDESGVEEEDSESSGQTFACGVCGEEFDTVSARKLHEQAMH